MADTAIELLEALVAFDTTSSRSNRDLVGFAEQRLHALRIPVHHLPSPDGRKATLVARIGPDRPGGVVLCGHTDVVPAEGQLWTRPAFSLTEEGDRLYGRGTTDMKGFLACVLALLPDLGAAQLGVPVTLAWTYDEEVGCLAAEQLGAHLVAHEPRPALVITGEPTSMQVVRSHKGVRVLRTRISGREAHSSRTDTGTSALTAMAELIAEIDRLAVDLAEHPEPGSPFQPPYTTVNIGTISGGTALNIVPRECEILWEYRSLPGADEDAVARDVDRFVQTSLLPRLWSRAPEAAVVTEVVADVPPLDPSSNASAAGLLAGLAGLPQHPAVAYGTDGSQLARAGLPTVVCGPGSMEQGHRPDEYVETTQLLACERMLRDVVRWCEQA